MADGSGEFFGEWLKCDADTAAVIRSQESVIDDGFDEFVDDSSERHGDDGADGILRQIVFMRISVGIDIDIDIFFEISASILCILCDELQVVRHVSDQFMQVFMQHGDAFPGDGFFEGFVFECVFNDGDGFEEFLEEGHGEGNGGFDEFEFSFFRLNPFGADVVGDVYHLVEEIFEF